MIDVITFDPKINDDMLQEAEFYRQKILYTHRRIDAKIIENYTPERFDMNDQSAISLFFLDGEVRGISTLFRREEFGNAYRCLNRLHFDNHVRTWGRDRSEKYDCNPRVNEISPQMVEQQAKYCDADMLFISSEPWKPRWASMIAKNFSDNTSMTWHTDEKLYPMCHPRLKGCWQHLIWSGCGELLTRGIERSEYEQRFNER